MLLLRLIPAAALLASAFTLQAAAQATPITPKTAKIFTVSPQSLTALQQQASQAQKADPTPNSPCATLRVYGFTPKDLKSDNPRASKYTTCTRVASNELKEIMVQPATVKTVNATPPTR
jgi:hypothetical protein